MRIVIVGNGRMGRAVAALAEQRGHAIHRMFDARENAGAAALTPERLAGAEVAVEFTPAERGCPTKFELIIRLPDDLPEEQAERLRVIAAKCPVHRTLDGEVMFQERVERVHMAA